MIQIDASTLRYYERRARGLEPSPDNRRWPLSEDARSAVQEIRQRKVNKNITFGSIDYRPSISESSKDTETGIEDKQANPYRTNGWSANDGSPFGPGHVRAVPAESQQPVGRTKMSKFIFVGFWTEHDEEYLLDLVQEFEYDDWSLIAQLLKRDVSVCQEKYRRLASLELMKVRIGLWSSEEDADLVRWIEQYNTKCWVRISHFLQRSPDDCMAEYKRIVSARRKKPFLGVSCSIAGAVQKGVKRPREEQADNIPEKPVWKGRLHLN